MKKVDLHIHTNFSDGLLTPKEILEMAKKNKVEIMAITDHDTFDGYREVKQIAGDYGIELIPGVEISTSYKNKDVHVLAYYPDVDNKRLNVVLDEIQHGRFNRAKKILASLEGLELPLRLDRIIELAGKNDLIGRPHIARAMVDAGYVKNKNEAFDKYLGEGCEAYHPKPSPATKEIIKIIKNAGGISILAHPQTLNDDLIVQEIIAMGIDGLEVFYAKSSAETKERFNKMALENNIIRTGGTDFHGDSFDEEVFVRYKGPYSIYLELSARMKKKKTILKRIYEKI